LLVSEQFEEGLKGDQRGDPGHLPAGGLGQHFIDFAQLWNAVQGQAKFVDTVQVFLASAAFDHFQLARDQSVPHRVFFRRVVDKTLRIGLAGHVVRLLHTALLLGIRSCYVLR